LPSHGRLRAALYSMGAVTSEKHGKDGVARMNVRLPRADWNRLVAQQQLDPSITRNMAAG
jgi:GTP-binding protein HflX